MSHCQQNRRARTPRFAGGGPLEICILWMLCSTPGIASDYYVSGSGDDGASGTSPAAAWRSMAKVNGFPLASGDVVHFECGGQWRGRLVPRGGSPRGHVTYTSHGNGPKPLLLGSIEKNEPGDWRPVDTNLWRSGPFPVDVGNIVFNDGQTCGIKVWTEAEDWRRRFGRRRTYEITGVTTHASLMLPKILWIDAHLERPQRIERFVTAAELV